MTTNHATDPFGLRRFVDAQEGSYAQAVAELRAGRKRSHWMWFVFPQFDGLGSSAMAQRYAIRSLAEARAYLHHPLLGTRIVECTRIVNGLHGRSAREIFGAPDDRKFRSSMTLFARAGDAQPEFDAALDRYFGGDPDSRTLERLSCPDPGS